MGHYLVQDQAAGEKGIAVQTVQVFGLPSTPANWHNCWAILCLDAAMWLYECCDPHNIHAHDCQFVSPIYENKWKSQANKLSGFTDAIQDQNITDLTSQIYHK